MGGLLDKGSSNVGEASRSDEFRCVFSCDVYCGVLGFLTLGVMTPIIFAPSVAEPRLGVEEQLMLCRHSDRRSKCKSFEHPTSRLFPKSFLLLLEITLRVRTLSEVRCRCPPVVYPSCFLFPWLPCLSLLRDCPGWLD